MTKKIKRKCGGCGGYCGGRKGACKHLANEAKKQADALWLAATSSIRKEQNHD